MTCIYPTVIYFMSIYLIRSWLFKKIERRFVSVDIHITSEIKEY